MDKPLKSLRRLALSSGDPAHLYRYIGLLEKLIEFPETNDANVTYYGVADVRNINHIDTLHFKTRRDVGSWLLHQAEVFGWAILELRPTIVEMQNAYHNEEYELIPEIWNNGQEDPDDPENMILAMGVVTWVGLDPNIVGTWLTGHRSD